MQNLGKRSVRHRRASSKMSLTAPWPPLSRTGPAKRYPQRTLAHLDGDPAVPTSRIAMFGVLIEDGDDCGATAAATMGSPPDSETSLTMGGTPCAMAVASTGASVRTDGPTHKGQSLFKVLVPPMAYGVPPP